MPGEIPVDAIGLVFPLDRFMSETRSITNLFGNAVTTIFLAKWEGQLDVSRARAGLARTSLASLIALGACSTSVLPNGRWSGAITPTFQSPTCEQSRGVIQIAQGKLIFTPNEGTWILYGTADATGTLEAEHAATGANRQPYETYFLGKLVNDAITGTYTTPHCTFAVRLARI